MPLDVSRLSPADCVAALRSYPRRFRAAFMSFADDDQYDNPEAVELADHVARSVAMLGEAMRRTLVEDAPFLLPAVLDASARDWQVAGVETAEAVLDFVTVESNALADAVEHVDAESWARKATVAGGGQTVTALDVAREAVRTGAEGLKAVEAAMSKR